MQKFMKKISSRKFLTALAGVISGLVIIFGLDQDVINTIAGAVTAMASVIGYISAEAKIDAAAVQPDKR